jgi:hypothetical protein
MLDYCSMLLGALAAHVGGRWSAGGVNHVHHRLTRGQGAYFLCACVLIAMPFRGFSLF